MTKIKYVDRMSFKKVMDKIIEKKNFLEETRAREEFRW